MNDTTKICITVGGVAWLAAVTALALCGQPEIAGTLIAIGAFVVIVFVFFG